MSWAVDEADLIEPEQLPAAVIDDLRVNLQKPAAQRRRMTIREMRAAIEFEVQLVCVAASNVAQGIELAPSDIERVWLALERIVWIWDEGLR